MKVSISRPVVDDRDIQHPQTAKNCKSAYDADSGLSALPNVYNLTPPLNENSGPIG